MTNPAKHGKGGKGRKGDKGGESVATLLLTPGPGLLEEEIALVGTMANKRTGNRKRVSNPRIYQRGDGKWVLEDARGRVVVVGSKEQVAKAAHEAQKLGVGMAMNPQLVFHVQKPGTISTRKFTSEKAAIKYAAGLARENYTFVPVRVNIPGDPFLVDHVWVHQDGTVEPRSESAKHTYRSRNPLGDVEDSISTAALPDILLSLKEAGSFRAAISADRFIIFLLHSDGDITAQVRDKLTYQEVGPAVMTSGTDQIQDAYHFALHNGTLEGWAPGSMGMRSPASMQNPAASAHSGIKFVLGIRGKGRSRKTETQSVLFDKSTWSVDSAKLWLKEHGMKTPTADMHGEYFRFRQQAPGKYKEFRTIDTGKAGGRKGNPESSGSASDAASMFEAFHGTPSTQTEEFTEEERYQVNLTELGSLHNPSADEKGPGLKVQTFSHLDVTLMFTSAAPKLACSPDGRQLYFVGGSQKIDLDSLKMSGDEWEKPSMVIGVLYMVTYQTEKGFDQFQLTDYFHELGEETGVQPLLIYDTINHKLSVSGGQYQAKDVGLVN